MGSFSENRLARAAVLGGVLMAVTAFGSGCIPVGVRHLYHLLTMPEDLYDPIVTDGYFFAEDGASRSYSLEPRYYDYYEIGLMSEAAGIPADFRFRGRVEAEFFVGEEEVEAHSITSVVSASYAKDDMDHYAKVVLLRFELPLVGGGSEQARLKLSVTEPDSANAPLGPSLQLYVAVSATP